MAAETNSAQRDEILRRTPMAREGSPEDIGQAVVYFTQARYVTGQVLRVDGGLSVG
jgi:NAD(P)-dependent dehydrogenase (short-subunit alcohol dehydrogenase family)